MTKIFLKITIYILTFSHVLVACSSHTTNNTSSSAAIQDTGTTDSKTVQKNELTKIYVRSIAEYIKAVNKENKISFDTLFFGKRAYGQPDDFPDIALPVTIENTPIRLVSPEAGFKKLKERKSLVYINMIGWVDNEKAEFIFVTFSNGGEPQFNCFINYGYNATLKEFELANLRFEGYPVKKER